MGSRLVLSQLLEKPTKPYRRKLHDRNRWLGEIFLGEISFSF
jgi:hypothetical protein